MPGVSPWPAHLIALPQGDNVIAGDGRYVRVRIFDPGNKDGHVDVGFVSVAKVFRPSFNFSPDQNGLTFQPHHAGCGVQGRQSSRVPLCPPSRPSGRMADAPA
jgi:hypothetical protein